MATEIPFLMYVDSMKLKETALQLREFNKGAHMAVSCTALLALIDQATSPNLGMATTKELRTEYECRMSGDHISRADDYKTFDPLNEH